MIVWIWPMAIFSVDSIWLIPAVGSWVMFTFYLVCSIAGSAVKSYVEWEYETLCPNSACSRGSRTTIKRKKKKIGIWALDIGSNGCRLTSSARNWKLNEGKREMNTRRLIQLTELWSEQIEARLWDMFRPDPLRGAISRQSRLVYICVGHTVWRVIGVWGCKSRVEVEADAIWCKWLHYFLE